VAVVADDVDLVVPRLVVRGVGASIALCDLAAGDFIPTSAWWRSSGRGNAF
jgi:hypothetical protein